MPPDTCCRVWSHRNRVGQRLDFFLCSRRQFVPILPQIESNSDSIYYVCAFFRDSKAIAFSYDRFVIHIFIRQNHFQRHIFPKAIQPQGASRHHDGAATGKLGTTQSPRSKEEIESLPDSISSRPNAAAIVSGHRPYKHRAQAVTTTARRPENWEQGNLPAPRKKSGRCPTRFRRDQTRQQVSAGTARPEEGG